jgi:cytochrome d ubiquinol oxidase subunit I
MIFVMHLIGVRRNDSDALSLARKWAKVSALLFAIGAGVCCTDR